MLIVNAKIVDGDKVIAIWDACRNGLSIKTHLMFPYGTLFTVCGNGKEEIIEYIGHPGIELAIEFHTFLANELHNKYDNMEDSHANL